MFHFSSGGFSFLFSRTSKMRSSYFLHLRFQRLTSNCIWHRVRVSAFPISHLFASLWTFKGGLFSRAPRGLYMSAENCRSSIEDRIFGWVRQASILYMQNTSDIASTFSDFLAWFLRTRANCRPSLRQADQWITLRQRVHPSKCSSCFFNPVQSVVRLLKPAYVGSMRKPPASGSCSDPLPIGCAVFVAFIKNWRVHRIWLVIFL